MILSFVVAVADNNAIGRNNALPWHMPNDLKFFKRTTMGKPVIMGRKTYDSMGKPLPGRLNVVLSGQKDLQLPEGVLLFHHIKDAIAHLETMNVEEACIIGGGRIFEETMPVADKMYITRIHTTVPDADVFFPDVDHTHWKLTWSEHHNADEKNPHDHTFELYERIEL
ncbi:dihydrofolate reductase [Nemorincola caseinilytica]|uniref:Dihydrofolate reductase n=1 Tax=Nemorincola caseinilytica TaxID=2054315 RepID=A0ABP8NEP4_9BACT